MGIQKFKTNLANAIVNIDNASIKNIKESKLPDLLENIKEVDKDDIPQEMDLLWTEQLKILKTKSPKGYRWHPK